jgi:hypothetical protein
MKDVSKKDLKQSNYLKIKTLVTPAHLAARFELAVDGAGFKSNCTALVRRQDI